GWAAPSGPPGVAQSARRSPGPRPGSASAIAGLMLDASQNTVRAGSRPSSGAPESVRKGVFRVNAVTGTPADCRTGTSAEPRKPPAPMTAAGASGRGAGGGSAPGGAAGGGGGGARLG